MGVRYRKWGFEGYGQSSLIGKGNLLVNFNGAPSLAFDVMRLFTVDNKTAGGGAGGETNTPTPKATVTNPGTNPTDNLVAKALEDVQNAKQQIEKSADKIASNQLLDSGNVKKDNTPGAAIDQNGNNNGNNGNNNNNNNNEDLNKNLLNSDEYKNNYSNTMSEASAKSKSFGQYVDLTTNLLADEITKAALDGLGYVNENGELVRSKEEKTHAGHVAAYTQLGKTAVLVGTKTLSSAIMGKMAAQAAARAAAKESGKVLTDAALKAAGSEGLKLGAKSGFLSAIGGTMGAANIAIGIADAILAASSDRVQNLSKTTKTINTVYDGLTAAANAIPVAGQVISLAMAGNKLITDSLTAAGVGTDQITTMDQIMDSAFLKTTVGLPNALTAKRLNSFKMDKEALANMGNAYKGAAKNIDKQYLFLGRVVGGYNNISKMNKKVDKAGREMGIISKVNLENALALANATNPSVGMREELTRSGGARGMIQAARHGNKLYDRERYKKVIQLKNKKKKLQEGGTINRTLDQLITYAKELNPRFIQRMSEPIRFITWEDEDPEGYTVGYSGTHEMAYDNGIVFPMIQEIDGTLTRITDAQEARDRALASGNYLEMNDEEAKLFTESNNNTEGYKKGWATFFEDLPEDFWEFWETLPEDLLNNDSYRMYDYWRFNNKPETFEDALNDKMFVLEDDGKYNGYSVAWDPLTGYGEFMKSKNHPSVWMEIEAYNKKKPVLKEGRPKDSHNRDDYYLIDMTPEEADWLDNYDLDKSGLFYRYIPKNADDIQHLRKGGAFNVIPEGALHKNRHHLEDIDEKFKDVTNKGIPVITEEGDEIVLHAEVEKEEIILRYEVTKKIEKLMKEGTDEAAIKAGELLVYEILHNTVDNTNKMI